MFKLNPGIYKRISFNDLGKEANRYRNKTHSLKLNGSAVLRLQGAEKMNDPLTLQKRG